MAINSIISQLEGIEELAGEIYLAKCPSHPAAEPSLLVRDVGGGHIIMHCFGGCNNESILKALGLNISELYPDRPKEFTYRPFNASDVLAALCTELLIVQVTANDMVNNKKISAADMERLRVASNRITKARELALGK